VTGPYRAGEGRPLARPSPRPRWLIWGLSALAVVFVATAHVIAIWFPPSPSIPVAFLVVSSIVVVVALDFTALALGVVYIGLKFSDAIKAVPEGESIFWKGGDEP